MRHIYIRRLVILLSGVFVVACLAFALVRTL
jgi:hypothetical protein